MKLADMKAHPRNTRRNAVCDSCEDQGTIARRSAATNRIMALHNAKMGMSHHYLLPHDLSKSLACHRMPHTAADCTWDDYRKCACDCHIQPTQALVLYHQAGDVLPNATGTEVGSPHAPTTDRTRHQAGFHRSDACWTPNHLPGQCTKQWCDCNCHLNETPFARMLRCGDPGTPSAAISGDNSTVQVGNKIGHVMWVVMEDGASPVRMVVLPDGAMIGYDEVA